MSEMVKYTSREGKDIPREDFYQEHRSQWEKLNCCLQRCCINNIEAQTHQILASYICFKTAYMESVRRFIFMDKLNRTYLITLVNPEVRVYVLLPRGKPELKIYDIVVG